MSLVKIITFYIGVDVLGFPLTHEHKLVYDSKFYQKFVNPQEYRNEKSIYRDLRVNIHNNKNQLFKNGKSI